MPTQLYYNIIKSDFFQMKLVLRTYSFNYLRQTDSNIFTVNELNDSFRQVYSN